MPQFRDAYARTARAPAEAAAKRAPEISDLPIQEVPASGTADEFALLLTGDGGWAGLDQELAARLAATACRRWPSTRSSTSGARAPRMRPRATSHGCCDIILLTCGTRQRVLLVGYSFGADVLPFIVNRLPPDLRARVASVSLLGIDSNAAFEVRVTDWVGARRRRRADPPGVAALTHLPVLCLYGAGESRLDLPGASPPEHRGASRSVPGTTSAASTPPSPTASWPSRAAPRPVT